ncbi:MAG: hypothetical protein E7608_04060 [Ruminococcaceae bacterium]|nr:hypothetical protein [Oscillospiraceae bacterium]
MNYFYNDAIIEKKMLSLENMTLTYRLFENSSGGYPVYSLLITMSEKSAETDLYIPDISISKDTALRIFRTVSEKLVLPSETPYLFSDGAFDEIFSDNIS